MVVLAVVVSYVVMTEQNSKERMQLVLLFIISLRCPRCLLGESMELV